MKTKQFILIISVFCLAINISNAQESKKFEFDINGFYGLSGFSGSITNGSINPGLGYQLLIDGKCFFTPNVGVGIGAGYATYTSKADLGNYISNTPAVDDENENFEYRVSASGIKERLHLSVIEIPVFLAYRKSLSEKLRLLVHAGFKVSLPLTATYNCSEGMIETKGYYSVYNVEFSDMPNHGFEAINKISYSGNLTTSTARSLFADVGVSFPMGKMGLKLSLYGSYGLNSVLKAQNDLLIDYPGRYNSLSSLSEKVSLVSGGLRLGLNL